MRAVTVAEPGGPEVLGWGEVPDPVCGPGEVIVDVAATAVNRADLLQRQGFYPPPPASSPRPGSSRSTPKMTPRMRPAPHRDGGVQYWGGVDPGGV